MRRLLGITPVLGVVVVLALIAISVAGHPTSIQAAGNGLPRTDVTLLLVYGLAATWVWYQRWIDVRAAIRVGAITGFLLGVVLAANHIIELFVPARAFALVISPVFLTFLLLGAAGSIAWQRTQSVARVVVAGGWCAVVATLIMLSAGLASNLVFEVRAELPLTEPFAASGMSDPGAFLVRNSLEAAGEVLVRLPVLALVLSLIGASENAWITHRSRSATLIIAWIAPLALILGAAALWYADSLERSTRPPLVMVGVLLCSVSLSAAHPIWSALRHRHDKDMSVALTPPPD